MCSFAADRDFKIVELLLVHLGWTQLTEILGKKDGKEMEKNGCRNLAIVK